MPVNDDNNLDGHYRCSAKNYYLDCFRFFFSMLILQFGLCYSNILQHFNADSYPNFILKKKKILFAQRINT